MSGIQTPELNAALFRAKVLSVDAENRTVDVIRVNVDAKYTRVMIMSSAGNYSMPDVGDVGLVIGDVTSMYWLGRLDFGYKKHLAGAINPKTGKKWGVRLIDAGAVQLVNLATRVGLYFSNSADFSLTNDFSDGIKYIKEKSGAPLRWLKLLGRSVSIEGANVFVNAGTVMRNIIGTGFSAVNDMTGAALAKEFSVFVKKPVGPAETDAARLQMGDVLQEPVAAAQAGVPEVGGIPGGFLRVLLAGFTAAGIIGGALKIDNLGNAELSTLLGNILINGISIHIGGFPSTHPAVLGDQLLIYLNTHAHSSSIGPTGTVVTPAAADLLSTKVLLS